jgi:filamentous hemagglutinin family protein
MKKMGSLNHLYRLVWSQTLKLWVAVAENTKGRSKGNNASASVAQANTTPPFASRPRQSSAQWALGLTSLTLAVTSAWAAPTGGQAISEGVTISQQGNTTTITQSQPKVELKWNSFNINSDEIVNFVASNQLGRNALAINRIADANPSRLYGQLNAEGQVYLINPNGVILGQGVQINVGGLVVSTLTKLTNQGHTVTFQGDSQAGLTVEQGALLNARQGGYLALIGQNITNQGVMQAPGGAVALAAGNNVSLTLMDNAPYQLYQIQIDADQLAHILTNQGAIQANGGTVWLNAGARNAALASAINNTGLIEAQTVHNRQGQITLEVNELNGQINLAGTLDASALNGGAGGDIATNAASIRIDDAATITTFANQGLTGSWSIDPTDFTISANHAAQTVNSMGNARLNRALAFNIHINGPIAWAAATNLTLTAHRNIHINNPITWGGAGSSALTLRAANNIHIDAALTGKAGASLMLKYGQGATDGADSSYVVHLPVTLPSGRTYATQQGSQGVLVDYTVINRLGAEGDEVNGADSLQGIANSGASYMNGSYALGSDIDASDTVHWNNGAGFVPIGSDISPFVGNFDGLGHTIAHLTINNPANSGHCVGLLGCIVNSAIQNIGLLGGSITGNNTMNVGGLVGANYGGMINNSYTTATVNGLNASNIGGLVGLSGGGSIANSYAAGAVTSTVSTNVGGLVGNNGGTISNSYASGAVNTAHSSNRVGGLAGVNYGRTIDNIYATGAVDGANAVGGLIGLNYGVTVTNSYATGAVGGTDEVGGLVGRNYGATINASYATGQVIGANRAGGLIGASLGDGIVSYSYWDTLSSGQANSAGGAGLSNADMMKLSSFHRWDIANTANSGKVWRIYEGYTAPLLTSFLTPLVVSANDVRVTYTGSVNTITALDSPSYSIAGAELSGNIFGLAKPYDGDMNVGTYLPSLYSNQQGYDISYGAQPQAALLTIAPLSLLSAPFTPPLFYAIAATQASIPEQYLAHDLSAKLSEAEMTQASYEAINAENFMLAQDVAFVALSNLAKVAVKVVNAGIKMP